jgi:hypothetical protein
VNISLSGGNIIITVKTVVDDGSWVYLTSDIYSIPAAYLLIPIGMIVIWVAYRRRKKSN